MSETNDAFVKILKEIAGILKEILKAKDTAPVIQLPGVQQPTKILILLEIEKENKTMKDLILEPTISKEGCEILENGTPLK